MPQLDRIIIFPQIFWFFVTFIFFYSVLIHYFLPRFLVSLKLRKQIVKNDYFLLEKNMSRNSRNKLHFLNNIAQNLNFIKSTIYLNSNCLDEILKESKFINPLKLNLKIISLIKNNVIFCNKNILNSIELNPSNLNLRKDK